MKKKNLNVLIGSNLKSIREQKGLSLEQTAKKTAVSKPMLGQIERGTSNPTVSTLWKIATGLGVSFSSFLRTNNQNVQQIKKTEVDPLIEKEGKFLVYSIFPMSEGKPYELFSIELLPGCHYESTAHSLGVEEQVWVDKGTLKMIIDDETFSIHEQEGIRFHADHPHVYVNSSDKTCIATLVIYYPVS